MNSMAKDRAKSPIDHRELDRILSQAGSDKELFDLIVNAPFRHYKVQTTFLFLGIIVLLVVDKKTGMINRVALSDTDLARLTTAVSVVPFKKIKIPLDASDNIIATAIKTGQPQDTTDWKFLFTPTLKSKQARINQANAGIAYSVVYPLDAWDGGALIYSYYQYPELMGAVQKDFMAKYSRLVTKRLRAR